MKTLLIIIVAVVVLGGGFYYYKLGSEAPAIVPGDQMGGQVENQPVETPVNIPTSVKEFTVEGRKFSFTPDLVTVKKGDTVRITFKNLDGFHDLVIDEFNWRTSRYRLERKRLSLWQIKPARSSFTALWGIIGRWE